MGKNYDNIMELLGRTAEIADRNTKSTADILSVIREQDRLMSGLSNTVSTINDTVNGMKDDIQQLKLNEEVTTTQQETIVESAQKRICEILGDDPLERQKYFKIFIQRLYKDTRRCAGLGSKIARTRKGDYQRCIDYIEAWVPNCGCAELRSKADENAKARIKARRLGYDDRGRKNAKTLQNKK